MMEQARDFLDESEALHALIEPLSALELKRPTAFKGWTIGDVIGHLHVWNHAADLTLTDEAGFEAFMGEVSGAVREGSLNSFEKQWLDGLSGTELVAAWRLQYERTAENYGTADPSARVKWVGPDMSARSSITARLMETWAHGQEIYDVLGVERENADRIGNIAILGVNTYGWTYKTRREDPPGPMPFVKLTAPSGASWEYGDAQTENVIEGAAEEFCQVVTQTRNIADTGLAVTGSIAKDWMSKAQCFAGPPETPPAPGTRTINQTR